MTNKLPSHLQVRREEAMGVGVRDDRGLKDALPTRGRQARHSVYDCR
eukprot:CAMPEP_0206525608 /NCGR_PEP_ID=MMETSP0325_2-20121206/121_1 /ASSEMBLY_ACC=CAM_ASM_000347 /TAXON_ID=2866 /ORGANISM="Crypthecodinium cohnii, Strain Seligo" /LENGTH=46 /DNA_ID= /DNA_START= /DNA_END= /DNA_ORIENTATION=